MRYAHHEHKTASSFAIISLSNTIEQNLMQKNNLQILQEKKESPNVTIVYIYDVTQNGVCTCHSIHDIYEYTHPLHLHFLMIYSSMSLLPLQVMITKDQRSKPTFLSTHNSLNFSDY